MTMNTTGAGRTKAGTPRRRDIFAVGRGQYENIGDVLLRRPLLDWAREAGRLHVYVGSSPDGYDEGLGLEPSDTVYRSFRSWYAALLRTSAAGAAHSLYKPGEIQLTMLGMKEHLVMLPAVLMVRARGGRVARIGAGARNFAAGPRALMWPSNMLSSYTRWRDHRTADYLGFGRAMPDLGFSDGMPEHELRAEIDEPSERRELLVVSLRGDSEASPRPYPRAEWLDGVRSAARRLGLRVCVVTQVSVDDTRSRRVAADLDAELVGWPKLGDHSSQEQRLRAVYRRAAVVASDRLHVLIAGFTEGAVPMGLQLNGDGKVARHFETIGLSDVGIDVSGLTAAQLCETIVATAHRRSEMLGALVRARAELHDVRSDLHTLLTGDTLPATAGARP